MVYSGPVRDGAFGHLRENATVARCGGCGADRLNEESCPDATIYETEAYRAKLCEELSTKGYYKVADPLQIFNQEILQNYSLRGKTVADIGCAVGSFLDHVSGIAKRLIAVEPSVIYHQSLQERGYDVFPYASSAEAVYGEVDCCVSIQVIEHVRNPRGFLEEIAPLLRDDGYLIVSTPNRDDILMSLLPQQYPAFFYRVVHRWYFDQVSLARCAELAGYEVVESRYVHRYGMANVLRWLRDCGPTGAAREATITPMADSFWKAYLEAQKLSDCLYMVLRKTT